MGEIVKIDKDSESEGSMISDDSSGSGGSKMSQT